MKFSVLLYLIFTRFEINYCNSNVSSTKCEEYGKAVYVQSFSPVLSVNAQKNVVSECGIVSVPLIVGGTSASEKEFPHMAVIGYGETPESKLGWDCGGTLISELYVLTAAHCLESRELGPSQVVRLGTIHLDELDPDVQERVVIERIRHPDYKPPLKANDIGLIKLQDPVEFTPYVRPACLNTADINPGRKGLASGFGKLSYDAETGSKNLMKVLLNIYPNNRCSKAISLREKIKDTMLCAGKMEGGKDTCQGDSGGPLQIVLEKPYCMYSIIGVTSFGKFCGFANAPAIYTKVSAYVPWIESIVWK